jgi:hypothetical protein
MGECCAGAAISACGIRSLENCAEEPMVILRRNISMKAGTAEPVSRGQSATGPGKELYSVLSRGHQR